jgi:hypothetical protein
MEQERWPIMADNGRKKGDLALLLAFAAGHTVRDAASLAGIGERTATRRIADPEYRRQITELRADMVQRALGKLVDAATQAVDTLRGLLAAESESVKLGAARSILELGCKVKEAVELELRIAALEQREPGKGE